VTCDMDPSIQKLENSQWPAMTTDDRKTAISHISDVQRFQNDYIDIIPKAWTAISISLSESRHELCLTKLEAGHSPFVLRLPLGRNNSRDADEEVFGFDEGKAELLDIIENANTSAHGARNISGKEAKNAWWAERDELDARLKELLENIEKVWLGGFRGIFSQHMKKPDLLARFQKSFQNALDKHLPSRQKAGKKTKAPKIILDTRILELFIGLGNPSDEDCDMDEALTDLLYFVVDILQFHGERNAYDEIDFDSLVLDTLDALRCYHQASMNVSINSGPGEDKHTILILDKTLHPFPWESLPCMDGLAVSRLPSLGCLRDRILEQQNSNPSQQDGKEGHYISRNNGAYILNPSGDLKSTQTTFSMSLSGLDSWTSIVQRIPTEADITECLTTKDVYLYFGHGSGAQYIRSKTIKKLEKCATTVLMGCSSGALTEAGEFEPYGPVMSYLLAGAPAVVGTLWDVTDRDIDRLAGRAFEGWGLYRVENKEEETEKVAEIGKGKDKAVVARGRGKQREVEVEVVEEAGEEKISLVEAVARARTACKFRYLTAAAAVVYGVPVYFK
jgi:separase